MAFSVKHEDISPQMAHEYLSKSAGNRHLNSDHVLALAVAMEQGKWDDSASEVVFDEDGSMIDGHHRLHAIVAFGKPVRMLVKRGVSKSARGLIDTGRPRTVRDLFGMFRPEVEYVGQRKASLATCVGLIVPGRPPAIRTLDSFDSWMRQFKDGIDAAVNIARVNAAGGGNALRLGPVSGAFAFAHKLQPRKVEAFMEKVRDGVGLVLNEPAYTLRALVTQSNTSRIGRTTGGDRTALSKKVLGAIHAEIRGLPYRRAQVGMEGVNYFRTAYDGKTIERLVDLWTHEATPSPSAPVVQ